MFGRDPAASVLDVTVARNALTAIYGAIAVLALLATWHQNVAYLGAGDPITGMVRFWRETLATPASVSITVDLFLFGLAAVLWMVVEARRLGIRYAWLYVIGAMLVAISVTVPLFLIARERRLRALRPDLEYDALTSADIAVLTLFAVPTLTLSLWSLLH